MNKEEENSEIDIIIRRIKHLYPNLDITSYNKQNEVYLIKVDPHENKLGSGTVQKWKVEEGKAVFIGAFQNK